MQLKFKLPSRHGMNLVCKIPIVLIHEKNYMNVSYNECMSQSLKLACVQHSYKKCNHVKVA